MLLRRTQWRKGRIAVLFGEPYATDNHPLFRRKINKLLIIVVAMTGTWRIQHQRFEEIFGIVKA